MMKLGYMKKEFKKLGSIGLIGFGTFLLIEHIYSYGGIDLWDLLGHEWLGIILVISGILSANRWGRLKLKEGLVHTKDKIKYIIKGGKK